jgi:DNA polymerase III epsilon subunit family exonuclease
LLAPPLRRALARLEAAREAVPLEELAQRLLALTGLPERGLARRLLASALGCPADLLPDAVEVGALPRLAAGAAADVPLEAAGWVVVDLETTGLSAEDCTILEIGAVRVDGLRVVDRFQTLVDPAVAIPARISALTGIDRSLVDGAPRLARAIDAFRRWVGEGPATIFVAHNATFDERFVRRALAEHDLPPWPGPVLCTRRLARRLLPDLARYDLDTLSAHFGIGNAARHRALGDAEAAARALLELVALAQADHGLERVGDLIALQHARPPGRRRRPRPRAARAEA